MKIFFDTNVYVAEALLGEMAEQLVEATEKAGWRIFCSSYTSALSSSHPGRRPATDEHDAAYLRANGIPGHTALDWARAVGQQAVVECLELIGAPETAPPADR